MVLVLGNLDDVRGVGHSRQARVADAGGVGGGQRRLRLPRGSPTRSAPTCWLGPLGGGLSVAWIVSVGATPYADYADRRPRQLAAGGLIAAVTVFLVAPVGATRRGGSGDHLAGVLAGFLRFNVAPASISSGTPAACCSATCWPCCRSSRCGRGFGSGPLELPILTLEPAHPGERQ
ncbi:MAG: hypothetical protein U0802_13980 [Candidatus Binatia bacterium]